MRHSRGPRLGHRELSSVSESLAFGTRAVSQVVTLLRSSPSFSNDGTSAKDTHSRKRILVSWVVLILLLGFGIDSQARQQGEPPVQYRGLQPMPSADSPDAAWREHKNYALLFATNKYESWPSLANPIPDAESIAKVLEDDYGFETEVDSDRSKNEILTILKKYQKRHFNDGDQLLIFFAGHGSYDEATKQGFIVARDTKLESEDENELTYESFDDLQANIDAIPVKHLLLIVDACFGGAFDRRIGEGGARGLEEYSDIAMSELFAHKIGLTTRKYITSGGKTYVSDGVPGQHSPFVRNLLMALSSDGGDRGYLTFANIEADVQATKPEPYGGDWGRSDIGSDFFFISKGLLSRKTPVESSSGPEMPLRSASPSQTRHSIAVLGLKDLSARSEDSWVPAAFGEELTTELLSGGLRPIAGEDVTKAKTKLALQESSGYSRETLNEVQKMLGVDWVVSGSYSSRGNPPAGRIRVDLRVQDAQSGEIIAEDGEEGTVAELSALVSRVGDRLRAKLGVQVPSAEEQESSDAALPSSAEASKAYTEGLAKLRVYDLLSARDLLKQAVAADPKLALAHAALADAWFELGYDQNAKDEGRNAFDLSALLPLETRLNIEGSYRQKTAEWSRAVDIYNELWRDYPDDIDYALALASAQTSAGKGSDALATLDKLRSLDQRSGDDPRVDYQEALAAKSLSDAKRQQAAAARAAEKALAHGSNLLVAEAYWQECTAFFDLNDLKSAEDACQKANQAADYAGGQKAKARSLTMLSRVLAAEGKTTEAMAQSQSILQMASQIGSKKDITGALINLANLEATEGRIAAAQNHDQEAIGIAREIGDKQQLFEAESDLAAGFATLGDYQQAKTSHEAALTTAREAGDQAEISIELQNLGSLSLQMGELTNAERDVRQALGTSQNANLQSTTASGFGNLGDIQMVRGDLAEARKNYEDELRLFTEIGDQPNIASSRLSLAKLALEEGKITEAEDLAHQAIKEFQDEKLVDNEGDARNTLARVLISRSNMTAAQDEIESAARIGVQDCAVKISLAITAARLKARGGELEEARQDLDSRLTQAKEKNLIGLQFEIRLALTEIEVSSDPKSKRTVLAALGNDARNSGYVLVAAKARHLQTLPSN
jgi:tetratricopeptide (TPR) repeat protein